MGSDVLFNRDYPSAINGQQYYRPKSALIKDLSSGAPSEIVYAFSTSSAASSSLALSDP